MWHYHFFYVSTDMKLKTCSPSYFSSLMKMKNIWSLKVLIGVRIFTSTSSFDTQSLQFVTMGKLKKSVRRFVTFYFLFGSSIQCLLSVGIRSFFTQRDVCRKIGQMYQSIVEKYFSFEVTSNLRIALMNNTLPKRFFCWFYPFC